MIKVTYGDKPTGFLGLDSNDSNISLSIVNLLILEMSLQAAWV